MLFTIVNTMLCFTKVFFPEHDEDILYLLQLDPVIPHGGYNRL